MCYYKEKPAPKEKNLKRITSHIDLLTKFKSKWNVYKYHNAITKKRLK